jgi:oxygen-dependent protoporphyrinogen oxidase
MSSGESVAVVGAGPSGLAAAFRLTQAGYDVTVFEAEDRPGGKMKTTRHEGYLIEDGPSIISKNYLSILGLAGDAGLGDELIEACGIFGFPREGTVHYFDPARLLRDGLRSRLISPAAKARLPLVFLDCLRHRKALTRGDLTALAVHDDESAEVYGRRVFGAELHEYIGGPTLRALAGSSPHELSKLDLLYCFNNFLGAPRFYAFRGGMGGYAHAMASKLAVRYQSEVVAVQESGDGVQLTWRSVTGPEKTQDFAGCVLATDAHVTSRIHSGLDAWSADFLARVTYTPIVDASIGLSRPPADVPASFILIPESESPELFALGMEHTKVPDRAPAGKGLMTVYGAPEFSREVFDHDDDTCAELMMGHAEKVLPGCTKDAEFVRITRWNPTVMTARPGYWRELSRFNDRKAGRPPRIALAGDYFCTSNINSATTAGERAARDLQAALRSPARARA